MNRFPPNSPLWWVASWMGPSDSCFWALMLLWVWVPLLGCELGPVACLWGTECNKWRMALWRSSYKDSGFHLVTLYRSVTCSLWVKLAARLWAALRRNPCGWKSANSQWRTEAQKQLSSAHSHVSECGSRSSLSPALRQGLSWDHGYSWHPDCSLVRPRPFKVSLDSWP